MNDYNKWLKNEPIDHPRLTVAYDMGWQQRSSEKVGSKGQAEENMIRTADMA